MTVGALFRSDSSGQYEQTNRFGVRATHMQPIEQSHGSSGAPRRTARCMRWGTPAVSAHSALAWPRPGALRQLLLVLALVINGV